MSGIFANSAAYFVLIGAFGFGVTYNALYTHYAKQGLTKRYTALAVSIGCAMLILIAGPFIGLEAMLYLFALFAAAGAPMTWGDILRSHAQETRELKEVIKQAHSRKGPRDWPNHAKNVRDDCAEELNRLAVKLTANLEECDPHKLQLLQAYTLVSITACLRRLEAVAAPTRPPQP